ncbi:MAG: hypothetical protein IT370_09335 [Deltaproteobacteria bacterium]|nr:hypothetical protein [Deltaproteobacteria bacterium]
MPPKRKKNLDLPRGLVRRSDGTITRKFSVYVDPEVAKRFQIRCVELGLEMTSVIADLVAAWVDGPPRAPKRKPS